MHNSLRLQKRSDVPAYLHILLPVLGVVAALVFCAAVILSSRRDICMRGLFILVPICTLHLLLSFLQQFQNLI